MAIDKATPTTQILGTLITADMYNQQLVGNLLYLLSGILVGTMLPMLRTTDIDEHWLICDGRYVGNGSSNANGRANADMETLFTHLWNNTTDTYFPMKNAVGGLLGARGASAASDWASNYSLPLPDMRGRTIIHLDGSAGRVSDAAADILGGTGGNSGWATASTASVAAGANVVVTSNSNMQPYMALAYLICTGV